MGESHFEKLRRLHRELHNRLTHYRYNRQQRLDERYRKGRIDALEWLCRLVEHYLEEEKRLDRRLHLHLEEERRRIRWLPASPYREGIEESLGEFYRLLDDKRG